MERTQKIRYFGIDWNSKTDGKGIRTVIFLQGCNLTCPWCHSPHSQPKVSPVLLHEEYCDDCRKCAEVCPQGVHTFNSGNHRIQSEACISCGLCISNCPKSANVHQTSLNALNLPTKETSPEALFENVYPHLDLLKGIGGVTVSGGEPMLQYKALKVFLEKCKAHQIPTTIETSGSVPFNYYEEIHAYVDDWLFGIRPVKDEYSRYVADIDLVIDNVRRLSQLTNSITVRLPLINGVLDSKDQVEQIIAVMHENNLPKVEMLPFNPYTNHYYRMMGRDFMLEGDCHLSMDRLYAIQDQFEKENINTQIVQFK
jgi:pyruvate formate lyase activating enzyme